MKDLEGSLAAAARQTAEGCVKTEEDLARYRLIFESVKPGLVIEIGSFSGKSAVWFARLGKCPVVSVDVDQSNMTPQFMRDAGLHDMVLFLKGYSTDPAVTEVIREWAAAVTANGDPVLVVLDGDHSAPTVAAELELYAPLVTVGSYCVVEDTIVRWMPWEQKPIGPYRGSPLDAVEAWLPLHPEWVVDLGVEDQSPTTQFPGGWLRRVW